MDVWVVNRPHVGDSATDAITGVGVDDAVSYYTDSTVIDIASCLLKLNAGETFQVVVENLIFIVGLNDIDELFKVGGGVACIVRRGSNNMNVRCLCF